MGFLEESARVLTQEQMLGLLQLLDAQREQRGAAHVGRGGGRRAEHGRAGTHCCGRSRAPGSAVRAGRSAGHEPPAWAGQMVESLDLSDEKLDSLREIQRGTMRELQALRREHSSWLLADEDVLERARDIRARYDREMEELLGADDWNELQELRTAHRATMSEVRLAELERRTDRRAEFLSTVLGLDERESDELRTILRDLMPQRYDVWRGFRGGEIPSVEEIQAAREVRAGGPGRIFALLDERQRELFEALEALLPAPRPGERRGRGG
jgi:Spy/CpxP family protein refolding chaperone